MLDQALFAGANFAVNVLLARWLTPEAYGAYTVAFTVFLLLGTVHQGLLTEPMLVFGTGRFRDRLPAYLGILVRGHGVVTGVGLIAMVGAAAAVWAWGGSPALAVALLAIGVGQAGILLAWFARSTSYVTFEPHRSAQAGGLYAVVLLGTTGVLYAVGALGTDRASDAAVAVAAMAVAGAASGIWLLRRAGAWPPPVPDAQLRREATDAHRGYGPWAAAAGGVDWLAGYAPLLWLSVAGGLDDVGAYRALYNLALPALHVLQAIGTLLVPVLVRAVREGQARRVIAGLLGAGVAGGGLYLAALAWGGRALLHALYDGKFDAYGDQLIVLGLVPLVVAALVVVLSALRALERPRALFGARVVALAAVVGPTAVLGGVATVGGALGTLVAIEVASVVALGILTVVALRQPASRGQDPALNASP